MNRNHEDSLLVRKAELRNTQKSNLDLEKIETEVPVPERLFRKDKSHCLVESLKLSQKIGLLLWMNKQELISEGGKERLLYLQRKASEEAIIAGIRFSTRLSNERKLQADFYPHMVELNRRPQSRRFRKAEKRRIGVGYRDKGTLPDYSTRFRERANELNFISVYSVPEVLLIFIQKTVPTSLEGDWIDLEEVNRLLRELETPRVPPDLLTQL